MIKIAAIFGLSALSACGYQLVGKEAHLPAGVGQVAVAAARNKTMEASLEITMTQDLLQALKSDGRIRITSRKDADAILQSELIDAVDQPLAFDKFGRGTLVQVTVRARVYLTRPGSGKEIWSSGSIAEDEQYPVGDDYLANDRLRDIALGQVCQRISRIAVEKLATGF